MNENWARWIVASIYKHFDGYRQDISLHIGRYNKESDWAELRIGGPDIEEFTRGCFRISVNIDIMVTVFPGNDIYRMARIAGIFLKGFIPICIYRYGEGDDDDNSLLGTLQMDSSSRVLVTNFGILLPENNFERSTLEAEFRMYLPNL